MESSAVKLTICLFLLAVIGQGFALKCWSCTSSRNQDSCTDPFNKTRHIYSLRDCEDHRSSSSHSSYMKTVCKKIKYRESDDGELMTLRKCDWVNENTDDNRDKRTDECGGTSSSHWKIDYCATCMEDGCNGSHRVALASTWCVALPALLYLFSKTSQ